MGSAGIYPPVCHPLRHSGSSDTRAVEAVRPGRAVSQGLRMILRLPSQLPSVLIGVTRVLKMPWSHGHYAAPSRTRPPALG